MKVRSEAMPTVLDLFSGCGGLSLGFAQAGFNIVAAYDKWQPAVATYSRNFNHLAYAQNIEHGKVYPDTDVIIGGPPCQGFSSAGMRKKDDHRNSLVADFARIVARQLPKAFVFENVEGFLTADSGRFLFDLLEPILAAGYRVHIRKVNAADYGVPQHRKRVLVIGGLGWEPAFPEATHRSFGAPGAGKLPAVRHLPRTPSMLDAIGDLPPPSEAVNNFGQPTHHSYQKFGPTDQMRAEALSEGQSMRDLPEHLWHESFRQRANRRVKDGTPTERRGGAPSGLRRLVGSEPAKAITGGALREFVHPTADRPLTIRECARLQTFPDSFEFEGTRSEQMQQIGNAVPVLLARAIATCLFDSMAKERVQPQPLASGIASFTPTGASAMSPILQDVTSRIRSQFMKQDEYRQEQFWY